MQVNVVRKDDWLPAVMIGTTPGSGVAGVAVMVPEPTTGVSDIGALAELEEARPLSVPRALPRPGA